MIELKNVYKTYKRGKILIPALKEINLTINEREFTCIVGPSGSGKTTLLNIIGLIDIPTKGMVIYKGKDITRAKSNELAMIRRKDMGFIFQSFNLISVYTVYENVELAYDLKYKHKTKKEKKQHILRMLMSAGLIDKINAKPNELSGGEQQRVSIARALVKDPLLVLADEPTANLDSKTGEQVIGLMKKMNTEKKTTFIFSTHDEVIMKHAKRILTLRDGMLK